MTEQEIKAILDKHKLWLDCKDGGERANLAGANLAGANLAGARLYDARLACAKLSYANLAYANLAGANLAGAKLDGAKLAGANLAGARLYDARLAGAKLSYANLAYANLAGANLAGAKIHINYTIKGELHQLANVGSEGGTLIIADCEEGWYFNRGCFQGGKDEFLKAVEKTHGDNKHGKFYKKIVELYTEELKDD